MSAYKIGDEVIKNQDNSLGKIIEIDDGFLGGTKYLIEFDSGQQWMWPQHFRKI